MASPLSDVAIIGAGLGGCSLALALAQHQIPVKIYESRPRDSEVLKSGVILTPNGLRILDHLGVLPRITSRSWIATHRTFVDSSDGITRRDLIAHDSLYGYSNHRIWRKHLLDELRQMLHDLSVPIHFSSRFTGILSETPSAVTFSIQSPSSPSPQPISSSLLIASDGLHSSLRPYLSPISPVYTGLIGILSHIPRSSVPWPYPHFPPSATIQDSPGAIFYIPEDPEGEEIMVGIQVSHPDLSREELEALQKDPERLVGFFTKDYEAWGTTAKKIIDQVVSRKETAYAWPYMRMPKLGTWFSEKTGRVVLMGDAAHALPPSSGQGVNQALEDGWALVLLLRGVEEGKAELRAALGFWQRIRERRIEAVGDWAEGFTNVERLPEGERRRMVEEGRYAALNRNGGGKGEMEWLYRPRLEEEVEAWLESGG